MSLRRLLCGAICVVALAASPVSAQQYADAATLQQIRSNIDLLRQQVTQLRGMGADAATLNLLQENVRFLELQYSSLAGTGPAPGSPQMIAAERAWLETQYRNLQLQRQQLAQLGADRASLAMLDQSLIEMRRSIDALNTNPHSLSNTVTTPTPTFQSAPGFTPMPAPAASPPAISSPPLASYDIAAIPQCGFEVRPPCRRRDGTLNDPQGSMGSGGGGNASDNTVNWGQKDKRKPLIQIGPDPSDAKTRKGSITRYDIGLGGCSASESRVDFSMKSTGDNSTIKAEVKWSGQAGCKPKLYTKIYLRLELDGLVGWLELKPSMGTSGQDLPTEFWMPYTKDIVYKISQDWQFTKWDAATARRLINEGRVAGYIAVTPK